MILLALVLATAVPVVDTDADVEPTGMSTTPASAEFLSTRADVLQQLEAKGFEAKLRSPALGATPSDEELKARIKEMMGPPRYSIPEATKGTTTKYDVILQPGHYARIQGATGASGKRVTERELVAYVTAETARRLRKLNYNVLVIPADGWLADSAATPAYDGLSARLFLAVHAEGSTAACKAGPSLGYSAGTSPYAMHSIGWAVSKALGYKYKEFAPDGYTANLAHYYMFRNVKVDEMAGLLEIGEITCDETEARLIDGSQRLGRNVADAIDFILHP